MRVALLNARGLLSGAGWPLASPRASEFTTAYQRLSIPILQRQYSALPILYFPDLAFAKVGTGPLDSPNPRPTDGRLLHGAASLDFTGLAEVGATSSIHVRSAAES